ncbi:MAG: hypothetical protein MI922_11450 [Bacteroidales bacterium]|nr:hypothetical protein [Bacteroidales bacterium]
MTGIQKLSNIVLIALICVTAVLAIMFFGGPWIEVQGVEQPKYTGTFIGWAVCLAVIAALLTIVFSFANIFSSMKSLKNAGMGIGAMVVLALISWLMSSDAPLAGKELTSFTLKWVDSGLYLTYILVLLAVAGIIYSEIAKALK